MTLDYCKDDNGNYDRNIYDNNNIPNNDYLFKTELLHIRAQVTESPQCPIGYQADVYWKVANVETTTMVTMMKKNQQISIGWCHPLPRCCF